VEAGPVETVFRIEVADMQRFMNSLSN